MPLLSICVISNKPDNLLRMLDSVPVGFKSIKPSEIELALSYQMPVGMRLGEVTAKCEEIGINFKAIHGEFHDTHGLFNYAKARTQSWGIATGEYCLIIDDDAIFQNRTPKTDFSSSDRVIDAIDFISLQDREVIVQLTGFMGSVGKGREFYPLERSWWNTNHGIVLKNHQLPLIDERLHLPGAGEDVGIFATHVCGYGYRAYKGFKAITKIGKTSTLFIGSNPNYSHETTYINGILGKIPQIFPNFRIPDEMISGGISKSRKQNV